MLNQFTAEENRCYNRQTEYLYFDLPIAQDSLDDYSCHSQAHVLEVASQCSRMAEWFQGWLCERGLAQTDPSSWKKDLELAAKLHDIGMCGTDLVIGLLDTVDELYERICSEEDEKEAEWKKLVARIVTMSEQAGLQTPAFHKIEALIVSTSRNRMKLVEQLAIYHDEIKSHIRKHHAPTSGKWIFHHAAKILESDGEDCDIELIAILATLHSTSSTAIEHILGDGKEADDTRQYLEEYLKEFLNPDEYKTITRTSKMKQITALASILRLADTRRSGAKLQTLDKRCLEYKVNQDGTADLYKKMPWGLERVTNRVAHEILLAEAATEFGLILVKKTNCWQAVHEIFLKDADNEEICRLFSSQRLYSYIKEIDTAEFAQSENFQNQFQIRLDGVEPKKANQILSDWRAEWKKGDRMQKRYADCLVLAK